MWFLRDGMNKMESKQKEINQSIKSSFFFQTVTSLKLFPILENHELLPGQFVCQGMLLLPKF